MGLTIEIKIQCIKCGKKLGTEKKWVTQDKDGFYCILVDPCRCMPNSIYDPSPEDPD